jgi:hypothetical protein
MGSRYQPPLFLLTIIIYFVYISARRLAEPKITFYCFIAA